MNYEAWRISFQTIEQAARAAFDAWQKAEKELEAIGAGGMEPLRKCTKLHQIAEPVLSSAQSGEQEIQKPAWDFDLSTSRGGRGYIAWFFDNVVNRTDFRRYIMNDLAADFACALATHLSAAHQAPALEVMRDALQEAESVLSSINMGNQHKAVQADSDVTYWQREEWCKWARDEVLPKVRAALAASQPNGEAA